jgi:hypothetical protein
VSSAGVAHARERARHRNVERPRELAADHALLRGLLTVMAWAESTRCLSILASVWLWAYYIAPTAAFADSIR